MCIVVTIYLKIAAKGVTNLMICTSHVLRLIISINCGVDLRLLRSPAYQKDTPNHNTYVFDCIFKNAEITSQINLFKIPSG